MDYSNLLQDKHFTFNTHPDGSFWELIVTDNEPLKQHICSTFKIDMELYENNRTDYDKIVLQCRRDFSNCIFYCDGSLITYDTDDFMKYIKKLCVPSA